MPLKSSYCGCACRDCCDLAIGDDDRGLALCCECSDAGCDETGEHECQRSDAYDAAEWEGLELPGEWRRPDAYGAEPDADDSPEPADRQPWLDQERD